MVIDSKQYNGPCSCGRTHEMATEFCLIESGCLKTVDVYLTGYDWEYMEGHRDTDRIHWYSWDFHIREAANMMEHRF